jgi:prevent-host-death family protein
MYVDLMEVAITEFRAALRTYVDRARRGEDVVLTERGLPVARLVAIDAAPLLEQLEKEGVITAASGDRPRASGTRRAEANGPVADLISEHRR